MNIYKTDFGMAIRL